MNDELGRHHMITHRGEFLKSIKERFKRETQLQHNINKLVLESDLDIEHAEFILGKSNNFHSSNGIGSTSNQQNSPRRKRLAASDAQISLDKVDHVINSSTVFYDSEDDIYHDVDKLLKYKKSKEKLSMRRRMTEVLVNKKVQTKEAKPLMLNASRNGNAFDDSHLYWEMKMKKVDAALMHHATEKGKMRRHRSTDDLLHESLRAQQFTRLARTAKINPFKIQLHHMPHKTSREMQLMTPEDVQKRQKATNEKNSVLLRARRQSFPSVGNEHWKEDVLARGVI